VPISNAEEEFLFVGFQVPQVQRAFQKHLTPRRVLLAVVKAMVNKLPLFIGQPVYLCHGSPRIPDEAPGLVTFQACIVARPPFTGPLEPYAFPVKWLREHWLLVPALTRLAVFAAQGAATV
jgi:hypothetical protein